MVEYLPQEILPGDLLAGGRFNLQTSLCLDEQEAKEFERLVRGKDSARGKMKWFHDHGYGNAGATSGHLIPGHERLLTLGWQGVYADLEQNSTMPCPTRTARPKGAQLRAMMTAATMPRDLAAK
jgi:formate C-acetyltransferase